MPDNDKKKNKKELKKDIQDNTDLTDEYMEKINESFYNMLKNPTNKEIEKHRLERDALISLWLGFLFEDFKNQLYASAQMGINEADRQLSKKGITKKVNDITKETYEGQVQARLNSDIEDIILTSQNIKINSENFIKELKTNPINYEFDKYKKISSELSADLIKRGITYYKDRANRQWNISKYIEMKTLTEKMGAQRLSFFTRAIQYGVDLVRIVHLNINPTCELCAPFEDKILSITGNTKGYLSLQDAQMYGLFHPRCDHVPEQLELAPTDKGNDGKIELNEANKKRKEYNEKRKEYDITTDKRINNISSPKNYKEYKKFGSFYNRGNELAQIIIKEKERNDDAVKYARKLFDENTLRAYYNIGELPEEAVNLLNSETNELKFSIDNLLKNIINHKDLDVNDYKKIFEIIKNPSKTRKSKKQNSKDVILFSNKNKQYYMLVVKTTANKKENFIKSFRKMGEEEYNGY